MAYYRKQLLNFMIFGCILGYCCRVLNNQDYGHRAKRFLVDSHSEPNEFYTGSTLCYNCSDFEDAHKCNEMDDASRKMQICFGELCALKVTFIKGEFYQDYRCLPEDACLKENKVSKQNAQCAGSFDQSSTLEGTWCTFCCQGRDHLCYGDSSFIHDCTVQADRLNQEIGKGDLGFLSPSQSLDLVQKLCQAAKGIQLLSFPGDPQKYIQCGIGRNTIMTCPSTLIWNNYVKACDFKENVDSAISSIASSSCATSKTLPASLATTVSSSSHLNHTNTVSKLTSLSSASLPAFMSSFTSSFSPPSKTNMSTFVSYATNSTYPTHSSTVADSSTQTYNTALVCDTCPDGKSCKVVTCIASESFCMNVVQIDQMLTKSVIKKGCVSPLECQFDHSHKNTACDPNGPTSSTGYPVICQYCCIATSNTSAPCNIHPVPDTIEWFGDVSTSTVSIISTDITNTTTAIPVSSNIGYTPQSTLHTTSKLQTSSETSNTTAYTSTSSTSLSTRGLTLNSSVLPSSTPFVASTTKRVPYTVPPKAITCNVCYGPETLCEKLFVPQTCSPPNNYCINTVHNKRDGTRVVSRRCGDFTTCYRDWFIGSSDVDKCRNFDERFILTLQFDCTFCCVKDNCNLPLRPTADTLYRDIS